MHKIRINTTEINIKYSSENIKTRNINEPYNKDKLGRALGVDLDQYHLQNNRS